MSETGGNRPDISELDWNTGPGANPSTPPTVGKKQSGWAFQDEVPHDELNYNWQGQRENLGHLLAQTPREFDNLSEALLVSAVPLITPGDVIRVRQSDPLRAMGDQQWNVLGDAGALTVTALATDGARVYYGQAGGQITAADPETGATLWKVVTQPEQPLVMESDGKFLYVGRQVGGAADFYIYNASTGALVWSVATVAPPSLLAVNGQYFAYRQATLGVVRIYSTPGGAPVLIGDVVIPGQLNAYDLAMSADWLIYTGLNSTDDRHVRAIDLATITPVWEVSYPSVNVNILTTGCVTDGDLVYTTTQAENLHDGTPRSLWAFELQTGRLVWTTDVNGAVDAQNVAVDDRYVYATDTNNDLLVCEKFSGKPIHRQADIYLLAVDGIKLYGSDAVVTGNNVRAHFRSRPSAEFARVDAGDTQRRPFHNLAVPIDGERRTAPRASLYRNPDLSMYKEDLAVASTTAAFPATTQFMSLVTPEIPSGDYLLHFYYQFATEPPGPPGSIFVAIDLDNAGTGLYIYTHVQEPTVSQQRETASGIIRLSLGGQHTIDLDFAENIAFAGSVTIYEARMILERIDTDK